jgi:hypothetical protein
MAIHHVNIPQAARTMFESGKFVRLINPMTRPYKDSKMEKEKPPVAGKSNNPHAMKKEANVKARNPRLQ